VSRHAVATWEWEPRTDRAAVTGPAAAILGPGPDVATLADYLELIHPDDRDQVEAGLRHALVAGPSLELEHRLQRPGGEVRWVSLTARVLKDADDQPTLAIGALIDITDRFENDGMHHWLRSIVEATPDVVATCAEDGRLLYLNRAGRRLLGLADDRPMNGTTFDDFYPSWAARLLREEAAPIARRDGIWQGETAVIGPDGKEIPVSQVLIAHRSPAETVTFSTIVRDISDRYQREEQLRHLAEHDPLTGLRNRTALMDHLRVIAASARRGARGALIYLDIDQFKAVNDTLGHVAGDRLLVMVAERLQAALHDDDILARLGGDEFGVLLRDVDAQAAQAVAERLRRVLAELRFGREPHVFALSASVGIAVIDGTAHDGEVLACADMACYSAKSRGRNRAVLYRPGQAEPAALSSDARWSARLKDALARGRLRLLYQPLVDLTDGRTRRYEVLARMVDDTGGLISPGRFIPAAERFGLVGDLDRWVLRRSVEVIRSYQRRGARIRLAINLSGRAFEDDSVLEDLRFEVATAGLEPGDLSFEITETAAVINLPRARRFIEELHELGCNFALDDFGSGFSSFAYLRYLPVDSVKIDGSFVRGLVDDPTSQALVRSMAEVARATGKVTVAECVEDANVLDLVRELGVDWAQGWHLGVPVPDPAPLEAAPQLDLR
jgi:diguanylate cyclase (GGDEF)-like protein/PAS domain S-box-containing protein